MPVTVMAPKVLGHCQEPAGGAWPARSLDVFMLNMEKMFSRNPCSRERVINQSPSLLSCCRCPISQNLFVIHSAYSNRS